jgi:hypothetical protein
VDAISQSALIRLKYLIHQSFEGDRFARFDAFEPIAREIAKLSETEFIWLGQELRNAAAVPVNDPPRGWSK